LNILTREQKEDSAAVNGTALPITSLLAQH